MSEETTGMNQRKSCQNLAAWHLIEGPGFEDYTHACDEHVGRLRSDKTTSATVIPEEYPCCYVYPAAREPGIYGGGDLVLPAADGDELEADLAAELAYERARDGVIEAARRLREARYALARLTRFNALATTTLYQAQHAETDVERAYLAVIDALALYDDAKAAYPYGSVTEVLR